LKTILGEPTGHTRKENNWIEFVWAGSGVAGHDTVTLSYYEGRQRVGLTLVQLFGAAAAKP
jgi:hypothetical protein